ncbi:MAG: PIG-L deacetylase family protein [Aeromonadaceae bacterium]
MNKNGDNILVIAAHPDDETIGCAGTIRKHITRGDAVYAISFTDGVSSRHNTHTSTEEIEDRRNAARESANKLGFKWIAQEVFPDNKLDMIPLLELAKFIEQAKLKIKPSIIYTHSSADLNIDHRRVHEATLIAFRPQPSDVWKEIRAYEIPSSSEWGVKPFSANLYINITDFISLKKTALACYTSEMPPPPHPRSIDAIETLCKLRGAQSGFKYAEAFEIIRSRCF